MSPRVRDVHDEDVGPEDEGDGLDARWDPDHEDEDGDEDVKPLTHLADDDYDRFVKNELGGEGWEAVGLSLKYGDLVAWPVVLLKRPLR